MSPKSEQFNIRWNNYSVVLQSVLLRLLQDERLVDVTLSCEGGSVKCHRLVLSACSSYFEKLFSQYTSTSNLVVFLKDLKLWELQALVHFMYQGEVSVLQVKLPQLVRAAESLKIKGLCSEAEDVLGSDMDDRNCDEDKQFDKNLDVGGSERLERKEPMQKAWGKGAGLSTGGSNINPIQQRSLLRSQYSNSATSSGHNGNSGSGGVGRTQLQSRHPVVLKRSYHQSTPPKLVKMQRLDDSTTVGAKPASSTSTSAATATSTTVQPSTTLRKPIIPSAVKAEVEADLIIEQDADDYEDEEDNFPHETSTADDQDQDSTNCEEVYDEENADEDMNGVEEVEGDNDEYLSDAEEANGAEQTSGGVKRNAKYDQEVKDAALSFLHSGMSLRQCSEQFQIPRKTLSKWKSRDSGAQAQQVDPEEIDEVEEEPEIRNSANAALLRYPPLTHPCEDANDRAERLTKATELALAGVTVRQAAQHFAIPRTTLCAYMKRRGITARKPLMLPNKVSKSSYVESNVPNSIPRRNRASQGQFDDFPFLGISDLMDEMQDYEDGGDPEAQDFQDANANSD